MHPHGRSAVRLVAWAILAAPLLVGCGGGEERNFVDDDTGTADDTGGGDSAKADTGGDTATGDTATGDTATGDTATGDTALPDTKDALVVETSLGDSLPEGGSTVVAPVVGGTTAESASYRLITTSGQIPGSTTLSSTSYVLKGGVVSISQP